MVNHGENELLSLPVKDSTDRPNAALRDVLDSFKNQDPFQWKNFVKNIRLQSRITDLNQMTSLIEEVCLPHSVIANGVIQRHLNVNQLFMQILMRFEKNRIMKKKLNAENSQTVDVVEILRIMDHIVILEYQSDKLVRFINEALLVNFLHFSSIFKLIL